MLKIRACLSKKSNTKFTRVMKGMQVVKSATNKLIYHCTYKSTNYTIL